MQLWMADLQESPPRHSPSVPMHAFCPLVSLCPLPRNLIVSVVLMSQMSCSAESPCMKLSTDSGEKNKATCAPFLDHHPAVLRMKPVIILDWKTLSGCKLGRVDAKDEFLFVECG